MEGKAYEFRLVLAGRTCGALVLGLLNKTASLLTVISIKPVLTFVETRSKFVSSRAGDRSNFPFMEHWLCKSYSWALRKLASSLKLRFPVSYCFILGTRYELPGFGILIDKMGHFVIVEFGSPWAVDELAWVRHLVALDAEHLLRIGPLHVWSYNLLNRDGVFINKVVRRV